MKGAVLEAHELDSLEASAFNCLKTTCRGFIISCWGLSGVMQNPQSSVLWKT